jgi:hypothetical protein
MNTVASLLMALNLSSSDHLGARETPDNANTECFVPLVAALDMALECLPLNAIECRIQRAENGRVELAPSFRIAIASGDHDGVASLAHWSVDSTTLSQRPFAQAAAILSACGAFFAHLTEWQSRSSVEVVDALFEMAKASATARGVTDPEELAVSAQALADHVVQLPDDWTTDDYFGLSDADACALRAHLSVLTAASRDALAQALLGRSVHATAEA